MSLSKNYFYYLSLLASGTLGGTSEDTRKPVNLAACSADVILQEFESLGLAAGGKITDKGLHYLEPYRAKRVIFMAAGLGSRMVPITINTPKPLVRVHGIRIIDRLIDACLAADIREIYIVRGYLGEQFDQLLIKYPMIQFLENSKYAEANNIGSAFVARHLLSNAYVMEADLLLLNPKLITKYHYNSDFLAIKKDYTNDWCFEVKDGVIVKEKLGGEYCWQMVGISYWNREDGARLSEDIVSVYTSTDGKKRYWEQIPLDDRKTHYAIKVRECFDKDVVEIDTFDELKSIDSRYAI